MSAGEAWKAKRERMGKTLEEVGQELRISRKYLQGIEESNFEKWPPRVFSSGFIRAYARMLEEDPEPVLTEYYAYIGTLVPSEAPAQGAPQWIKREHRRGSRRAVLSMAAAGVLLVGVLLSWYSMRTAPQPPQAPETAAPAPAEPAAPPGPAAPGTPEPSAKPAAPGIAVPPYQLLLEASELTWVMYSRDGADPVDVMLYPGDRISVQAARTITLKLGNAGGVKGTLNGEALPPFGEQGKVKEIRIGK